MLELPAILNIPPKLLPIITDFNRYKFFVIEGGRGPLAYGEKVLTLHGWRNIEDIKVGDRVRCPDNSTAEVIRIPFDGKDECYEFTFADGRKVVSGQDHLWQIEIANRTLKRGSRREIIRTTKQIADFFEKNVRNSKTKDVRNILIPLTAPVNTSKTYFHNLPVDPYLLGLILGDGYIGRNGVQLTTADEEIVQSCADLWPDGIISRPPLRVDFCKPSKMMTIIRNLGLYGCKSNSKFIPKQYKYSDIESRWAILQGLMDADGTIGHDGNCSFTSVSKQLASDVQELIWSLGGKATLSDARPSHYVNSDGKKVTCQDAYHLYIQIKDKDKIFRLGRKKARCTGFNGGSSIPKLRIIGVKPVGVKKCKCITIDDPRGLFLTNNYVVTHNSAKTQSIARLLLYIAEHQRVRIVCGREIQDTIEESVFMVLRDLITAHNLAYDVKKVGITHLTSGSEFRFKGFREQGAVNIKGFEGADILWNDEAQTTTKTTLDMMIPTIRKENSKLFFTLNRYLRDDAVMDLVGRPDCLHIKINYFDNPFCPLTLKHEAELCRNKSERDYRHIWLGEPLSQAGAYLFDTEKLAKTHTIQPYGDLFKKQRVMGVDIAAEGDDGCVATILDRVSNIHWRATEQIRWDENDTMLSVGKIVSLIGQFKPDVVIIDKGNMGKGVVDRLLELKLRNVYAFDGASIDGVDAAHYANCRANAYYLVEEWVSQGWLIIPKENKELVKQLEKIKMKYRSDGKRLIEQKLEMKKAPPKGIGYSPDEADSLMMAIWGAYMYLGKPANQSEEAQTQIKRVSGSSRRRNP